MSDVVTWDISIPRTELAVIEHDLQTRLKGTVANTPTSYFRCVIGIERSLYDAGQLWDHFYMDGVEVKLPTASTVANPVDIIEQSDVDDAAGREHLRILMTPEVTKTTQELATARGLERAAYLGGAIAVERWSYASLGHDMTARTHHVDATFVAANIAML